MKELRFICPLDLKRKLGGGVGGWGCGFGLQRAGKQCTWKWKNNCLVNKFAEPSLTMGPREYLQPMGLAYHRLSA